jgi:2'-5' RNA ligase
MVRVTGSGRFFVAMDLSIGVVERLYRAREELVRELYGSDAQVRWREPEQVRLVLTSVEASGEFVEVFVEQLRGFTRSLFPFELTSMGLGGGPDEERPRLIWAGFDERGEELVGLIHRALSKELRQLGLWESSQEYKACVYLGRVREGQAEVGEALSRAPNMSFGRSTIKSLMILKPLDGDRAGQVQVVERLALGV